MEAESSGDAIVGSRTALTTLLSTWWELFISITDSNDIFKPEKPIF